MNNLTGCYTGMGGSLRISVKMDKPDVKKLRKQGTKDTKIC